MSRPLRSVGLLLALVLPVTGCGIRATDVVEVGDASVVDVALGGPEGTILYFVHSGELSPVARPFEIVPEAQEAKYEPSDGRGGSDKALVMLLKGPDGSEQQAGLRTELPSGVDVVALDLSEGGVTVMMKVPVTWFTALARQQLICTAAEAVAPGTVGPVTVRGSDGSFGPDVCAL
jgi:hypothetical protein